MIECDAEICGGSNSTEIFRWIFVLQTEKQSFVNFFHALKRSKQTNRLTLLTYRSFFFLITWIRFVTEISEFCFREKLVENLSGSLRFCLFSVQNRLFPRATCSIPRWKFSYTFGHTCFKFVISRFVLKWRGFNNVEIFIAVTKHLMPFANRVGV